MTMQEFLDTLTALSARGYHPYLVAEAYGQTIRLKSPAGTEHCPITAVYECATGQTCPPAAVYSRYGNDSPLCAAGHNADYVQLRIICSQSFQIPCCRLLSGVPRVIRLMNCTSSSELLRMGQFRPMSQGEAYEQRGFHPSIGCGTRQ
jgi:hypothetical protein